MGFVIEKRKHCGVSVGSAAVWEIFCARTQRELGMRSTSGEREREGELRRGTEARRGGATEVFILSIEEVSGRESFLSPAPNCAAAPCGQRRAPPDTAMRQLSCP
jgi:hypothetical protein